MEPEKISYTAEQASDATGIPKRKLVMLCKEGRLRAVKVGKYWIIPTSALMELLNPPAEVVNG